MPEDIMFYTDIVLHLTVVWIYKLKCPEVKIQTINMVWNLLYIWNLLSLKVIASPQWLSYILNSLETAAAV